MHTKSCSSGVAKLKRKTQRTLQANPFGKRVCDPRWKSHSLDSKTINICWMAENRKRKTLHRPQDICTSTICVRNFVSCWLFIFICVKRFQSKTKTTIFWYFAFCKRETKKVLRTRFSIFRNEEKRVQAQKIDSGEHDLQLSFHQTEINHWSFSTRFDVWVARIRFGHLFSGDFC